ncbi:hypothetical protein HPP92_000795 [Vanilla planifolia]|uniref:Cell division cycle protein 123 homolog n=1 Tax=Vanilla planifolia TaxID=51239 RepID=A0A835VKZ3_VANPL|nr:hypothetical protein HPP92_000795 [Vanilla planifolia]
MGEIFLNEKLLPNACAVAKEPLELVVIAEANVRRNFSQPLSNRSMKEQELRDCQIQEWYPIFKPYSIRTLFHPLPDDFIRYILGETTATDGESPPPFRLPRPSSGRDPLPRTTANIDPISILDSEPSSFDEEADSDSEGGDQQAPSFPELESDVEKSIAALGGAVFPKLNWSSPKDAAWIATDGSLRCTSFAEIALLLHSSDRVVHDLCYAVDTVSDRSSAPFTFFLALRKFYPNLHPEMEFRCFVSRGRLLAISQREITTFYPSLLDRRHDLRQMIEDFFYEIVEPMFGLKCYTFDVYVTGDRRIKLLDFNPWGAFTLPLLFSWDELENEEVGKNEEGVELRLVESQCGVRPGLKTAVPYDYLDTGEGSGWDQFLHKVDDELRKQMKYSETQN